VTPRALISLRILFGQVSRQCIHVGFRLLEAHTRLEPAHRVHTHAHFAVAEQWFVELADGNVHIAPMEVAADITETFRDHADDVVRHTIQCQSLPHRIRYCADFAFPKSTADQSHRRRTQLVLLGTERPPEDRPHPEHREEIRRDHLHRHALRLAPASQVKVVSPVRCKGGKRTISAHPVEEVGIGNGRLGVIGITRVDRHQTVRLRVGKRIK